MVGYLKEATRTRKESRIEALQAHLVLKKKGCHMD